MSFNYCLTRSTVVLKPSHRALPWEQPRGIRSPLTMIYAPLGQRCAKDRISCLEIDLAITIQSTNSIDFPLRLDDETSNIMS